MTNVINTTNSEPLTITLDDGRAVTGTLWTGPFQRGGFEIEYNGVRRTDGRTDYTDIAHMRSIARVILREMAE